MLVNKLKFSVHRVMHCMAWCTFLVPYFSCVSKKAGSTKLELRAIELISSIPMTDYSGQIGYFEDTLIQFEQAGQILQQISVKRNLSVMQTDKDGNIIGNELISLPDGSRYFFYRLGNKYGVFYDTAQNAKALFRPALVDSLAELNTATNFEPIMKTKILNDSLVSSYLSADKSTLIEKYVPRIKKDETYSDTTMLTYFKSLNGIHFSFSKKVDSTRKMKLAKIELKFNAIPNHPELYKRKTRQLTFAIKEIPIKEQDYIISIFNKLDSVGLKQGIH